MAGILNKIKSLVGKEEKPPYLEKEIGNKASKDGKDINIIIFDDEDELSYPNLEMVHRGARICVGRGPLEGYDKIKNHIKKMMGFKHESILEHSNVIALIRVPDSSISIQLNNDMMEVMSNSRYMYVVTRHIGNYLNILIGGSIRAYINIIRETRQENTFLRFIKSIMYGSIEKEFLSNLIKDGLMEEEYCTYVTHASMKELTEEQQETGDENTTIDAGYESRLKEIPYGNNIVLLAYQDIDALYKDVSMYGFTLADCMQVCTVSFLFKNISRSCANQMTRHRVGISQESQRYCEHTGDKEKGFIDPIKLHEQYKTHRYDNIDKNTMDAINKEDPFKFYSYLIQHKIMKEDARAWLPMNCTTQLVMTFTYKQLFHFIALRTEPGAQEEVRQLASNIKNLINREIFSLNHSYDDLKRTALDNKALSDYQAVSVDDDEGVIIDKTPIEEEETTDEELDIAKNLEEAKRLMRKDEELRKL